MTTNPNPLVSAKAATEPNPNQAPAVQTSAQPDAVTAPDASGQQPATSGVDSGLLSASNLLGVSLGSLEILAAGLKNPEISAAAGIAEEVVPLIEAAIEKLLQVKGSTTTYGQLESLRFKPKW